jgi:hypothetical protein
LEDLEIEPKTCWESLKKKIPSFEKVTSIFTWDDSALKKDINEIMLEGKSMFVFSKTNKIRRCIYFIV